MNKTFKFMPYGPFEVPLVDGEIPKDLNGFWEQIETRHRGLRAAVGCYILAVSNGSVSTPWYVGKTVSQGFEKEAFESHKRRHYEKVLKRHVHGDVELYLIPRVTSTGKPRKKYPGNVAKDGKIGALEELLIGSALAINPSLANVKSKKQIQLSGYMNESGERSAAAEKLAKLLQIKPMSKRNAAKR